MLCVQMAYSLEKPRHREVGDAMKMGLQASRCLLTTAGQGTPHALVVYGWCEPATEFKRRGVPVVTMDMPWFDRRPGEGPLSKVKISVNHWHPTAYFQRRPKPNDRWEKFGLPILPMRRRGGHIVVAGSGPKSSVRDGNQFQQWERDAIAALVDQTDRPIIYRPKPYMKSAPPPQILGATMDVTTPLEDLLRNAHAVITRQSNVAVDAIRLGVPVFCWEGVGSALGLQNLGLLEDPRIPTEDERRQFFADLAYCQWGLTEIQDGTAWRHLVAEGLIQ